jgi:hypothetical protein
MRSGAMYAGLSDEGDAREVLAGLQSCYLDRFRVTAKHRQSLQMSEEHAMRALMAALDPVIVRDVLGRMRAEGWL